MEGPGKVRAVRPQERALGPSQGAGFPDPTQPPSSCVSPLLKEDHLQEFSEPLVRTCAGYGQQGSCHLGIVLIRL